MMKRVLTILFVLIGYLTNSQVLYDPTKFTVSNKSYGSAQSIPTEARSQFRDTTLPSPYMRNYANRAEILSYLYLAKYRGGKFPIYMDSATHTYVLWFRDGTADGNLVYWNTEASSTDSSIFETVYRTDTAKVNLRTSIAGKLDNTLATGKILAGNLSNVATAVTPGGDVTMTSGGSFSVLNQLKTASNGLTASGTNVKLGGTLTDGTTTLTSATNTESLLFTNVFNHDIRYINREKIFANGGQATALFAPTYMNFTGGDSVGIESPTALFSVKALLSKFYHPVIVLDTLTITTMGVSDSSDRAASTAWVKQQGYGGGSGSGITSLNALTATTQTFATGTSGTDFAISSASSTHTFNLPIASGTNTGKLSNTDWTAFNNKQPAGNYITDLTGDVTATGPGSVPATIANNAVTTAKINNNAVTYGKMQSMTANKLLGSGASGTAVAEITLGTGLSFTGTTLNASGGSGGLDSTFIKLGYLNVVDSGAAGDGTIVQDASITSGTATLTTVAATFVSTDVGKSCMVAGAGTAGADLYTTILTYNSSTSVTLATNASTTISSKEFDFGTDNSVPFQKCLNASLTSYLGLNKIVYVPLGAKPYFFFNPPVSSSIDGSNPYSQIYVPLAKYTPSDSLSSVTLLGQTPPNNYTDYTAGQNPPKSGVILQSVRMDSAASVLGSSYETVAWGDFNFVKFFMKNIIIRTRSMTSGSDVKPLMNAFNASQLSQLQMDNFRFDIQSSQATSVRPDTTTFGLKTPLNNNFADIHITNGLIQGYHSGIVVNEHTNVDNVIIATCYNALDFLSSFHSSNFGSILTIWNVNNLRILGATPIIMARWDIENYPSSASVKWFNHQYDVYEPTAVGALGKIAYTRIESGTGVSPLLDLSTNVDLKLNFTLIGDPSPNRRIGGLTYYYGSTGDDTYTIFTNESTKSDGHGRPIFATKRLGSLLHGFGSDIGGTGATNSYLYDYTRGMANAYFDGDGSFAMGDNAVSSPLMHMAETGEFGIGGNALSAPNFHFAATSNTTSSPTFNFGSFAFQSYNSQNSIYGHNLFFNGSSYQYIANGEGNFIQAYNTAGGGIAFGSAPTGTAGGSASTTNNLFISNAGNTYVGGNSDNGYKFEVNGISRFDDTGSLVKRFSYATNIHSTFTQYSLIDKSYADSAYSGGGSDTLNVVNEGIGLNLASTNVDTLKISTVLAKNGLTPSKLSDSTLQILFGGNLTQNTDIDGLDTYSLRLGTNVIGHRLTTFDARTTGDLTLAAAGTSNIILAANNTNMSGGFQAGSMSELSGNQTLTAANAWYAYNGSGGDTWTLPDRATNLRRVYFIKNAGSGNLTVSRAGSDQIYSTSAVTTITVAAGATAILYAGPSFWYQY